MSSISDDDDSGPSLKELVTKNLEANGILGKLQAQLRASVFLILEKEFQEKNIPIVNQKTNEVLGTSLGKIAISLIQDFLQCLNLEFALAVFCPETKSVLMENSLNREYLSKELVCRPSDKYPYLLQLIEDNQNAQNKNVKTNSFINPKGLQNEKLSKNYLQEEKNNQEDKQVSVALSKSVHEIKTADQINANLVKRSENSSNSKEKQSVENVVESLKKEVNSKNESAVKDSNSTVTSSYSNQSTSNNTLSSLSNNDQQSESLESSDKSTLTKSSESNKSALSEIEKYSEEDFSSASDSKSQTEESSKHLDKFKTTKSHSKTEEEKSEIEEAIETAEDIEEEISAFDDLLSVNSESSNKTKDISVSKEDNKLADYEESL